MNAILSLHHNAMSDEDIQELAFEIKNSLNQETDLTTQLPEAAGGPGTRGDAITMGQIILAAVGAGGAITALMPVLQAYVERKPKLLIEIETCDGNKIKIEAEHLKPGQIAQTTQAVRQLCDQTGDIPDNKGNG